MRPLIGTAGPSRFFVGRIKGAHLRGNITREKARADDEQQESRKERLIKSHREMTGTHGDGADHDSIALSDPAVGDHPAE